MEEPTGSLLRAGLVAGGNSEKARLWIPTTAKIEVLLISRENTLLAFIPESSCFLSFVTVFSPSIWYKVQSFLKLCSFIWVLITHTGLVPRQTAFFWEWFPSFIQEVKASLYSLQKLGMGRGSIRRASCPESRLLVMTLAGLQRNTERQPLQGQLQRIRVVNLSGALGPHLLLVSVASLLQFVPSSPGKSHAFLCSLGWAFPLVFILSIGLFFSILDCSYFHFMFSNFVMIFCFPLYFLCALSSRPWEIRKVSRYPLSSLDHSIYMVPSLREKNTTKTREKSP